MHPRHHSPRAPCPACGLPTLVSHPELFDLAIAHVDCDAFYASIEKRDNPELKDKPLIVGHAGGRGVVTTACYIARQYGPRSAMPMFKAMALCPQAVVIPPDMAKYRVASQQIRALMATLTPLVEPLSLDEAYLDLNDGHRLKPEKPAVLLAELAQAVKSEVGISISIGLADNKFLAKLASDLEKPRGFSVIGRGEAKAMLADMPVTKIHGVGPASARRLEAAGISQIRQLQGMAEAELTAMFGKFGRRLAAFVQGDDPRAVTPSRATKSISSETTFKTDRGTASELIEAVLPLCGRVAERLARNGTGRAHGGAETEDGGFPDHHTQPAPQRADAESRSSRGRCRSSDRWRGGWHAVSSDRYRGQRYFACFRSRPPGPVRLKA